VWAARSWCPANAWIDIDGVRPDDAVLDAAVEVAKTTFLAPMMEAGRFTNFDWKLARKAEAL
jgi:hypothetical protein